ncbi:MAG: FAD-dependent oxidoreductase, partial [Bacteroidales bacterium]|nr:FAD-dependent oxidoreductase [Bacteroidales bacterium]
NLLVAGRPISATSEAVGAVRVMPPCMAMGQAAGIAAAFAVRNAAAAKDVDIDSLRKEIVKQGGFLG